VKKCRHEQHFNLQKTHRQRPQDFVEGLADYLLEQRNMMGKARILSRKKMPKKAISPPLNKKHNRNITPCTTQKATRKTDVIAKNTSLKISQTGPITKNNTNASPNNPITTLYRLLLNSF
jgi:hypothetical protein